MKEVIDEIQRRLIAGIEADQQRSRARRASKFRGGHRGITGPLVGLATAIAATAIVVVALTARPNESQAAALPVWQRPAVDASAIRDGLPERERSGLDFRDARAFRTSSGRVLI